ncbi:MAG: hypothetical protein Ct9H300mP8_06470 [Gammaproteobacteria bacterium]|nr:MAG: hypothetical protein Ct9H300mP8_06470 [Gammaproteobacteria bacterium]
MQSRSYRTKWSEDAANNGCQRVSMDRPVRQRTRTEREKTLKLAKVISIVFIVYAALVATFESLLGYYQPSGPSALVIITSDNDGKKYRRVLSRLDSNGQLYVARNHWPRAWHRRALNNPKVKCCGWCGGELCRRPVSEVEHKQLSEAHPRGLVFQFMTGFPPRYFIRLDPR